MQTTLFEIDHMIIEKKEVRGNGKLRQIASGPYEISNWVLKELYRRTK